MKSPAGALATGTTGIGELSAEMPLPEIPYESPGSVADAVASLGRTEDVSFSPSNRRVALAALGRNRISVFDIDITPSRGGAQVALTGGVELSSPTLQHPHGVDFIDDDTLIVTSRGSGVALFKLPSGDTNVRCHEVLPLVSWPGSGPLFDVPGSVSIVRVAEDVCEVLICDNGRHRVTRNLLDRADGGLRDSVILLDKYLEIPDGVNVSSDRRWIAVSNHNTHSVLLYEDLSALNADREPDGILRCVFYPHGLCFTEDGRYLLVADAGAPYLHVYAHGPDEWRGVRSPVATVRIMDESVFRKGRHSLAQGGPKGLDINAGSTVVVVTSECQPLAFFDLPALLQHAFAGSSVLDQRVLETSYEMRLLQERHQMTKKVAQVVDAFRTSTSWRITAPLRSLSSTWRRRWLTLPRSTLVR